ncbi:MULTISPECIES: IPExxxVDY family protein [Nonlabens]|uniref:IPExxxVDY family protein n=1 Tax=Nonlabens TaxID=363408 RepID=UPI000CF40F2B|nr:MULTISPECIES: IPExxxVDY family protein [Nonlabens]PQJ20039.1 hypothetical protein BST93_00935 [Nonlabens tegetincola]
MATFKLSDWEEEEDVSLIGIHSSLPAYRVAYYINKHSEHCFERKQTDHELFTDRIIATFPVYKDYDEKLQTQLYLVANRFKGVLKGVSGTGLFETIDEEEITVTLLKEYHKVDFILKIEQNNMSYPVQKLINDLNKAQAFTSCYLLDYFKLKNKDYLIFE